MKPALDVLFVEDSDNDAQLLLMELRRGGWQIHSARVDTADAMQAALFTQAWDLIIADYSMPCFSGPQALALARAQLADVPFILVSGKVGEEMAVQAMKAGADDYLFKGDIKRLVPAVTRELRDAEGRRTARLVKKQLHQRELQLLDAQRLAHLGTWHADLLTGCAVWSDEACRMIGLPLGNSAQSFGQLISALHSDDRQQLESLLYETNITTIQSDFRLATNDQNNRFVHLRGEITRDDQGTAISAAGMIQDVTDRHLAEVALRHAREAAEQASRAKSMFLANMSHEIRTPMTAILGFADMMLGADQSPSDRLDCIQTVRRNAIHLLELINDILDLSKIEAGRMTVEKVPAGLGHLLADLVTLMKPRALEKGLGFELSFTGPTPARIQTDPLRLKQILVNLLGNAIKFTAAGKVRIHIGTDTIGEQSLLRVDIIDSGIGLTTEQIGRLFRPFTQAEESTTRKFGGTGLGLTISQQLASLLGGQITVESKEGVGSTFTLSVDAGKPCTDKMLTSSDQILAATTPTHSSWDSIPVRGRILLAEDGRDNQRLISSHLRTSGAEVVIVDNGKIAVETLANQPFDLVLMDMQMPVMDGYTAATTLRAGGFARPIIALTAYAMADDKAKCILSGCTDYLTKPIDRKILLTTVKRYLEASVSVLASEPAASPTTRSATIQSSLIDYPGMKNIVLDFVEGLPTEVSKLQDCLLRNDMDMLRRVVHQIRGAGGGYGFEELTEPATRAEECIRAEEDLAAIKNHVDSLIQVLRRIDGFQESTLNHPQATHIGSEHEPVSSLYY